PAGPQRSRAPALRGVGSPSSPARTIRPQLQARGAVRSPFLRRDRLALARAAPRDRSGRRLLAFAPGQLSQRSAQRRSAATRRVLRLQGARRRRGAPSPRDPPRHRGSRRPPTTPRRGLAMNGTDLERIDLLILLRLATSAKALSRAALHRDLFPFVARKMDERVWHEWCDARLQKLRA